jgi:CDP-glucose 4,6-dehydratase
MGGHPLRDRRRVSAQGEAGAHRPKMIDAGELAEPDPPQSLGVLQKTRVLMTGHTGFVGTWLTIALRMGGAEVVGLSSLSTELSACRSEQLATLGVKTEAADLTDTTLVARLIDLVEESDLVVHLAAKATVGQAYREPDATLRTNVGGLQGILEAVRLNGSTPLVAVTSDKCYGRGGGAVLGLREDDFLVPAGIYETSKAIQEFLCASYRATFDLPITSVRLANVLGGGDTADRLVPNCIRAFQSGKQALLSDPGAVRPWQSILDVCHGFLNLFALILQGSWTGGSLNFAPPSQDLTVGELVACLADKWGTPGAWVVDPASRGMPEERILRVDGRMAANLLTWRHRYDSAESLVASIQQWYALAEDLGPIAAMVRQLQHGFGPSKEGLG